MGLFAILLLLGATVTAVARSSFAATPSTGVAIPLYNYPDSTWTAVIQAKAAHPNVPILVVVNPNNGPGTSPDSNFAQGIKNFQSAGVVVLGYVFTQYGSRSYASIETDINAYKSWYGVNGIMFDEMSNVAGYESYYSGLNSYVKSIGLSMTMGNPGTLVPTSFIGTMDCIVIYENPGLPSISTLASYPGYGKSNFAFVAIGVPTLDASYVTSASSYVNWMYITDLSLPNPYYTLASYFTGLVAALDTPTTTSTTSVTTSSSTTSTTTATTSSTSSAPGSLTVQSVDLAGAPITGMWTVVASGATTLATGFTPLTFSGTTGSQYYVSVADYQSTIFNHWDDGSTNSTRLVTLSSSTTITAYYSTSGTPSTLNVSVQSAALDSAPIAGLWTVVQTNGTPVASGYTPLTFTTNYGAPYTISVSNYGSYIFDHWSTGSTSNSVTITPTQTTSLTAFYRSPVSLTVNSVGLNGAAITGMWTTIQSGGVSQSTGYTPVSFTGESGTQYVVTVANYRNLVFDHWDDGSTNPSRTITPIQDESLTAYYRILVSVTVKSALTTGTSITGFWTVVQTGGQTVDTGFTPLVYKATSGIQYAVSVSNYGHYIFDHWSNGSRSSTIAVTPTQATTLIAYYRYSP